MAQCFGERATPDFTHKVGTVDDKGVLWKATSMPGKFVTQLEPAMDTCYTSLVVAAKRFAGKQVAGQRPILKKTVVDGFEKLELGPYEYITYDTYASRVEKIGSGFKAYLSAGDTCMIYADTQLDWMISAFGCWKLGCVVATCYATLGEDGALFAINQSKAKLVVADAKLLKVLGKIAGQFTELKQVVTLTDEAADSASAILLKSHGINVAKLSDVEAAGEANPVAATPAAADTPAVLMYTSGTTGNPKGVLISHKNITAAIGGSGVDGAALKQYLTFGARFLAYLPLAHIMEFALEVACISLGIVIGYAGVGTLLRTCVRPPRDLMRARAARAAANHVCVSTRDRSDGAEDGAVSAASG